MNWSTIAQDRRFQLAAAGFGGIVAGAAAGYLVGSRRNQTIMEVTFDEFVENENEEDYVDVKVGELTLDEDEESIISPDEVVASVLEDPALDSIIDVGSEEKDSTPINYSEIMQSSDISKEDDDAEEEAEDAEGTSDELVGREEAPVEEAEELVNVFASADNDWNQEEEEAAREKLGANEPYILHQSEFAENEFGWTQQSLTFYDKDNTLADSEDAPIYGHGSLVGPLRFGHGSMDPNVMYVRNPQKKVEFEIFLYNGSYAHEVLGQQAQEEMDAELKHSEPRRFRGNFED